MCENITNGGVVQSAFRICEKQWCSFIECFLRPLVCIILLQREPAHGSGLCSARHSDQKAVTVPPPKRQAVRTLGLNCLCCITYLKYSELHKQITEATDEVRKSKGEGPDTEEDLVLRTWKEGTWQVWDKSLSWKGLSSQLRQETLNSFH